jgi:pyroglutamyl-peptidase
MILATAFNAFGSAETNASEVLLRALKDDVGIVRVVLRTEYEAAGREIVRLIRALRPEALVSFGVADGATAVRFEQIARNWDGSQDADNAGVRRPGQLIESGAPDIYQATLPYDAMRLALSDRQIPQSVSEDAGGYVCNHAFFRACHEIAQLGRSIPCGFIHVPPINSPQDFATFLEAMRICIELSAQGVTRSVDRFPPR